MPLTILVVDDNELNRDVLRRRLEHESYNVITAKDGKEALELLTIQAPDAMLLDIMMPVMDGYEVLDKLKESAKTKSIPVMMVTAVNDMQTVVKCIKKGAADYITKPFEPDLLRSRVQRLLSRGKAKPQGADDFSAPMSGEVLIVDDVDLNREVLERRLTEYGLEVVGARSGKEALAILAQKTPQLILLDIMMPEMDGYQVLAHLKKDKKTKGIPVLMISSVDEQSSIKKALQLGAADYVVKPFDNVLLKARIRGFLGYAKKVDAAEEGVTGWIESVKRAVKNVGVELPVPTDIATTVTQLSMDPATPIEEIAKIIEMDPAMTAKLLGIANSTFYQGAAKVHKIVDALTRIGMAETRHYVTTIAHKQAFNCNMKSTGRVMERVWLHSLACALAAKKIAETKGRQGDEFYTWGLLHDIGMAVAVKAIEQSNGGDRLDEEEIAAVLVAVHEELGAVTLMSWNMDERAISFASVHHSNLDKADELQLILACADAAAISAGFEGADPPRDDRDTLCGAIRLTPAGFSEIVDWTKAEMEKVKTV